MAEIKFITKDGIEITASSEEGTVMNLAVDHNVKGIDGDCGGVCSCATCHVHVPQEYWDKVGPPNQTEADMLEFDDNVTEYSRLSCQIDIKPELDGLVLNVANE